MQIEWGEFLSFSCLRLGLLDLDMLDAIKEQFHERDADSSGFLEKNEICADMLFGKCDIEKDGCLQITDFLILFDDMVNSEGMHAI